MDFPSNYAQPSPAALYLLQHLPSFHNTHQNHAQIMQQLQSIIHHFQPLVRTYIIQISLYLKTNIERNIKIIDSMSCLISIYNLLTVSFKKTMSDLLKLKYPCCNFSQQINKLRQVNQLLIQPYLCLVSYITQWHRLHMQDIYFQQTDIHQLQYQLQYLYAVSRYSFQSDSIFEGVSLQKHFLAIYRLSIENQNLFESWVDNSYVIDRLASSLFYIAANYPSVEIEQAKIVFYALKELMLIIEGTSIPFQDIIFKQFLPFLRKQKHKINQGLSHFVSSFQRGIIGILAADWSLDKQFRWQWRSKIVWDLLGLEQKDQVCLINELQSSSQQLMRCLEFYQ